MSPPSSHDPEGSAPPRRPVFLDPLKIRLPVTAMVSLAHRVSGLVLALALPWLVYWLSLSLRGPAEYGQVAAALDRPLPKLALVLLAWALAHHSAAGVRHMLFDLGIAMPLPAARRTAWLVNAFALAATLLVAGALL